MLTYLLAYVKTIMPQIWRFFQNARCHGPLCPTRGWHCWLAQQCCLSDSGSTAGQASSGTPHALASVATMQSCDQWSRCAAARVSFRRARRPIVQRATPMILRTRPPARSAGALPVARRMNAATTNSPDGARVAPNAVHCLGRLGDGSSWYWRS